MDPYPHTAVNHFRGCPSVACCCLPVRPLHVPGDCYHAIRRRSKELSCCFVSLRLCCLVSLFRASRLRIRGGSKLTYQESHNHHPVPICCRKTACPSNQPAAPSVDGSIPCPRVFEALQFPCFVSSRFDQCLIQERHASQQAKWSVAYYGALQAESPPEQFIGNKA
jgi:hypothetical protein